jgi:hypothetical protein
VYYEPSNVYTSRKEGLYEIWYTQDMVLLDGKGEVIQEWKDILEFHYTTRKPVLDLFARTASISRDSSRRALTDSKP